MTLKKDILMDYLAIIEEVREFTRQNVKKSRYEHSVRVAQMCARLCRQYGLDETKGYLAGIGHDMCKDFPEDQQILLTRKDGEALSDFELAKPSLLHGRAAAVLLKERFSIMDKDILEAVAYHTSARLGICDLGKCLFLADKIEPGRPQSTEEYRARLFGLSLDGMFLSVLEENYEYITGKGYEVYPETLKMIEYYREVCRKENEKED